MIIETDACEDHCMSHERISVDQAISFAHGECDVNVKDGLVIETERDKEEVEQTFALKIDIEAYISKSSAPPW